MAAIDTTRLTKRYGEKTALHELDLQVEAGEVFGFLGPNGAGKSTTINLLLDFVRPTDGKATVLGHDVRSESAAIRARTGILAEGIDLYGQDSPDDDTSSLRSTGPMGPLLRTHCSRGSGWTTPPRIDRCPATRPA